MLVEHGSWGLGEDGRQKREASGQGRGALGHSKFDPSTRARTHAHTHTTHTLFTQVAALEEGLTSSTVRLQRQLEQVKAEAGAQLAAQQANAAAAAQAAAQQLRRAEAEQAALQRAKAQLEEGKVGGPARVQASVFRSGATALAAFTALATLNAP